MRKIHSILASLGINGLTFVDAGAKDSLEYIQELDSITEIHAFEPNPDEFQTLQKLYSNHSFKKLKLNQIGLSNTNGGADFTITNHASMSSLLNPDLENYKKHFGAYSDFHKWETSIVAHNKVRIEVQTLDSYFANEELTLDYLKLDTQGSELLILQGAEDLISSGKVSVIKVEVSTIAIYKNQALFSDIDLFLRKYNYDLADFA